MTFHDIPDGTVENFDRLLAHLESAANVVTIDDFFSGGLRDDKLNVVITFDDGYRSWHSVASPLLKRRGLPATFFVASGLVEGSPLVADPGRAPKWLTPAQVRQLSDDGFTIGGHTRNHVNLGSLADEAEAEHEILSDKQSLERMTGREVRYFAYPFGVFRNPQVDLPRVVERVGYTGAVTTKTGVNLGGENRFLLRRELTGVPMSLAVFRARVAGAPEMVAWFKNRIGGAEGS